MLTKATNTTAQCCPKAIMTAHLTLQVAHVGNQYEQVQDMAPSAPQ